MSDAESTDTTDFDDQNAPIPVGVKLGSTRTVLDLPDERGGRERRSTLTCLATYEDAITGKEKALYGQPMVWVP